LDRAAIEDDVGGAGGEVGGKAVGDVEKGRFSTMV
jgi:hypothetical protein